MVTLLQVSVYLLWLVSSGLAKGMENVALNKRYTQSSHHPSYRNEALAANNNTSGNLESHNCIHTEAGDRNPSWSVDLGQVYPVWEVVIYARNGYLHRMVGVSVKVDQRICEKITERPPQQRIRLTCNETIYGLEIKVEKLYNNKEKQEENVLNICEVQIWVCDRGYFGDKCDRPCGKCNDTVCSRKDGKCRFLPCPTGYSGDTCQKCADNMFGKNCASTCGKCRDGYTCEHVTGQCPRGCAAGWTGSKCQEEFECPHYTFGEDCINVCGRCLDNVTCHHISGDCSVGCTAGWTGSRCNQECVTHTFGENCNTTCGKCKDNVTCHRVTGECSLGCAQGWTGHQCDKAQDTWDIKLIIGASGGGILGLIVAVVIGFVITKRRRAANLRKDTMSVTDTRENPRLSENAYKRDPCVQNSRSSGEWLEVSQRWPQHAEDESEAHWERLKIHILDKLETVDLETEFSNLRRGMVYECTQATMRRNRRKNRYKDILPYDHSRVVLEKDQESSDYINACYLQGCSTDRAYIAAQGPTQNTTYDFWRMVWQENVTQIIMLTKVVTKQNDKSKFFQYWPSTGDKQRYGQFVVTNVDEASKAHFVVRTFSVKKDNEFRHVEQFQFTGFTDQETHSTVPLAGFWRFVTSQPVRNPSSPPVIHCSAGVGQTGVYIALDIIMKWMQFKKDVSIFDVVNRMREDRCNMVNNKDYYQDLHKVVLEACVSRNTCFDMETFETVFSEPVDVCRPNKIIDRQCQVLHIMPGVVLDSYYSTVDENRVKTDRCITMRVAGRHLSIKAVFLPTLLDAHGMIVTRFPDSVETIWGLVESYRFSEIVSLGSVENLQDQTVYPYWPTQTERELGAGIYKVALTRKSDLGECLQSYNVTWQRGRESGQVRLFHYCDWQEDLPDTPQELVCLLNALTKTLNDKNHSPLLVQCIDGYVRSSMFCVLCHLMSQIAVDGSIDVFSAVRQVQSVIPEFAMSAEQYRFCYHVAQLLGHPDDDYVNVQT